MSSAGGITFDLIVVGGGVMGCAAASEAARRGYRVAVLEQFELGHALGSSHGPSRIIRLAYDGADYVALARASYDRWRALEAETGETLMVRVGGLDVGPPDALALDGIRDTYLATGVAFEELDAGEIRRRYPQFAFPEDAVALFQPDYALLAADRCVATLAEQAKANGAELREGVRALSVVPDGEGVAVETADGTIRGERVILAAGSWLPPLLSGLGLELPLVVLKEQLAFFAVREGENVDDYRPGRFPLVIHRFPATTTLGSFFPIFDHTGVKAMIDRVGPRVQPDDPDRAIEPAPLGRLRAYATAMVPGLSGEIVEAVSCRYAMTPDEDFVLDRHPAHPQIVIVSPCSGHGFKFAPAIGEIGVSLAFGGASPCDISRFRLDRPALAPAQAWSELRVG